MKMRVKSGTTRKPVLAPVKTVVKAAAKPVKKPAVKKAVEEAPEKKKAAPTPEKPVDAGAFNAVSHITVDEDEAGVRLDRFILARFPKLSHNHIAKMLRKGEIRLDGKRVEGNARLAAWQDVRLPPLGDYVGPRDDKMKPKVSAGRSKELLKYVIYEDDDVVVIDKPAGLAVQGGTGIKRSLDDELMVFAKEGGETPKLVHRLDRETSGVLVIARNAFAARALTAAFRLRTTRKYYLALVVGEPEAPSGEIHAPLLKRSDGRVMVIETGQTSHSNFTVIEHAHRKASALLLQPLTGRTHQLRVHCQFMGCPILGDKLYSNEKGWEIVEDMDVKTLQLHAYRLIIPHPRNPKKMIDVTAPLPKGQVEHWKALGFTPKVNVDRVLQERD